MNRKQRRQAAKKAGATVTTKSAPKAALGPALPTALSGGGVAGTLMRHATGAPVTAPPTVNDPNAAMGLAAKYLQTGRLDLAARHLQDLLDSNPDHAGAMQLLGVVHSEMGDRPRALELLRRAVALSPNYAEAHHNLGLVLSGGGEFEAAEASLRRAIALQPDYGDAWLNLGNAERAQGRFEAAANDFIKAAKFLPDNPSPKLNLAILTMEMAQAEKALAIFDDLVAQYPDYAEAHNSRGSCLIALGRAQEGAEANARALELEPENNEYHNNMREACSRLIPTWHLPMLADEARNKAYQETLDKHVRPGMHVLDIGAGSGLLAMMAARAGAERVTAVEMNPVLADVARQIVADNGYGDRIEVLNRVSLDLKVGVDLPAADLVVSEVLDAGLLGEGVLPTLRHATSHLMKPQARMVPAGATIYGQIVELPRQRMVNPVAKLSGFDLSAFDRFRNPATHRPIVLNREDNRPLSGPFHVAEIDFSNPPSTERHRQEVVPIIASGEAYAIVFWFDLHLDESISVSTSPDGTLRHWSQAVQFLDQGRMVVVGDELSLTVGHNDMRFYFSL